METGFGKGKTGLSGGYCSSQMRENDSSDPGTQVKIERHGTQRGAQLSQVTQLVHSRPG